MLSFLKELPTFLLTSKKAWLPYLLIIMAAFAGRLVLTQTPYALTSQQAALPAAPPSGAVEVRDVFDPADALPRMVETPAQPWAYGAQFKTTAHDLAGPVWIRVDVKVSAGPIGIGVLNVDGSDFLSRVPIVQQGDSTVTLSVAKGEQIGSLIVQTWDKPTAGNVVVEGIAVLVPHSAVSQPIALPVAPAAPPSDPPADAVEVQDVFGPALIPGSNLKLSDALPAAVKTPAQPWAYGAQFMTTAHHLAGPVWIRVDVKMNTGPIGIGVVKIDGGEFLSRVAVVRQGDSAVTLHVAKGEQIGSLVVQTRDKPAPGDVIVKAISVLSTQASASQHSRP
jgi:hypothetical protein